MSQNIKFSFFLIKFQSSHQSLILHILCGSICKGPLSRLFWVTSVFHILQFGTWTLNFMFRNMNQWIKFISCCYESVLLFNILNYKPAHSSNRLWNPDQNKWSELWTDDLRLMLFASRHWFTFLNSFFGQVILAFKSLPSETPDICSVTLITENR